MNRISAIRLPFHRLYLLDFWKPKFNSKLHRVQSLIGKLVLLKLWKEGMEPGEEVPAHIQADADDAKNQIAKAAVENDVCFAQEYFEAIKENRDLLDYGLDKDLTRQIILAYSQFYFENNPSPRPLVWVEATDHPGGITLAPRGRWLLAEPVEPTKDQLRSRLTANGVIFTRRAFDACLKKLGLSGPNGLEGGKEGRPSKKGETKK
jgi:hypothetical protein